MSLMHPMEPRDRVLAALDHREADRVPRDLAGTRYSSIHAESYARLRTALGLPDAEVRIVDTTQGLAEVHEDVLARFGADVALVPTGSPTGYRREVVSDGQFERFVDEWGVVRARPLGGLYYESTSAPLQGAIDASHVRGFAWPDPIDAGRFAGMAERARHIREVQHRAVLVGSLCAGVTEMFLRLRGYEDGYMDLAADQGLARLIMERITQLKLAYWERVLDEIGDLVDMAAEADDLGAQHAPLFSPQVYRDLVKPLHAEIVGLIKRRSRARFFIHSCGAIRSLIPDLIEIGVECLNPVQVSADGMDTATLKAEFGRDLTFWGGAVDPQRVLARGTPDEVRAETRRRIGDLKPGGGFVFASVHNIQAHVPVENILAMWKALDEAGAYG
jgi:uroporphyrinogen decarboxylase